PSRPHLPLPHPLLHRPSHLLFQRATPCRAPHSFPTRRSPDLRPDVEQRITAFLADNPRDKHGRHHYSFADTGLDEGELLERTARDRKSTRLNSSHEWISYAVFCLKPKSIKHLV